MTFTEGGTRVGITKKLKRGMRVVRAAARASAYVSGYYGELRERSVVLYAANGGEEIRAIEGELRANPAYSDFRVTVVHEESCRCAREMGSAKYLIAGGALPDWFTKREDQVLAVIGTMPEGRGYAMGGIQRTYLNSDYILCDGESMRAAIAETYFLDGLYQGRYVLGSDAAERCARVLRDVPAGAEIPARRSEREKVLIFVNGLHQNGLTTALRNLWGMLDHAQRDYYISFPSKSLADDPSRLDMLPGGARYIPMPHMRQESLAEKLAFQLYLKKNVTSPRAMRYVERYLERLYQRSFRGCGFDWVIDHNGYDTCVLNMLRVIPAKTAVYVHNDMKHELETRRNQHKPTLQRVYRDCDRVVPVTRDIAESVAWLSGRTDNIHVVNNFHDWRDVRERAELPAAFEPATRSNMTLERIMELLEGSGLKFISIGRYSPEKNHMELLEAFERFHRERPDSRLILIGGRGVLYEETLRRAAALDCADSVALILTMRNPMPILKRCDLFILPSLYEGQGLVLLEADTLGVPVVSTDVPGPRGFMREHGGRLIPLGADSLYQAMRDFAEKRWEPLNVDYDAYNRIAAEQFEKLFD